MEIVAIIVSFIALAVAGDASSVCRTYRKRQENMEDVVLNKLKKLKKKDVNQNEVEKHV